MAAVSSETQGSIQKSVFDSFGVFVKETGASKGKALYTSKKFSKGDTIFKEKPLVCVQFLWNAAYKYLSCDNCLKSLEPAQDMARRLCGNHTLVLPYNEQCCEMSKLQKDTAVCPRCQVVYCSEACRQSAFDQYHSRLCLRHPGEDPDHPLTKLQEAWKTMHYPPETANIMLTARMIATVLQAQDSKLAFETFNSFCHSVVNTKDQIAHKLLGPKFQEQLDMLRLLLAEALYDERLEKREWNIERQPQHDLLKFLQALFANRRWFTPEGFQALFALIGTNGQGIGTSSLSVYVKRLESLPNISEDERQAFDLFLDELYEEMDKVSGHFLNCEGAGLYSLQSCCNHSCVPNAEVTFPYNDSTLVLEALQDIQEGEEICISYLDECQRERSRHSRQKYLRENYLFNCACVKCELQANDPDVTSSEDEEDDDEDELPVE